MATRKLSAINSGSSSTMAPATDQLVGVRSGNTDLLFTCNTFSTAGIGNTSTDGVVLENLTAAAAGAQQWSPRLHLIGQGWKTTATAASETVEFIAEVQPVQGTAAPTGNLVISSQINGTGGYTANLTVSSGGLVGASSGFTVPTPGTYYLAGETTGMRLQSVGSVGFFSAGTGMFYIQLAGLSLYPGADNAYDIGSASARIRNLYLGTAIKHYQSVATAGWGVPAIYGSGRSTAQTGAVASVATYTVGAADGSFWIGANVNVTASTTNSFSVTCTYTDEMNTSRTETFSFTQAGVATPIQTITNVTGVGAYAAGMLQIRCKAGTTITIATAGTFTSVTYNVEGSIVQIA